MAISLGDAELIFTADQTQLNAALEQVPVKTHEAFAAAAESVKIFDEALDATGENVAFAGEKVMSLTQAFRTLAVQGPELLKQKLDDAKTAFAALEAAGVNAKGTLLQATIKVTEKEIAYQRALGQSTVALNEQLAAMQKQYAEMGGPLKTGAANLGDELEKSAHRGSEAFHETRGSLELLGEQVGVHLPRELRSFVAAVEPIQGVLSAAFKGIAILALIQIIYEVIQKTTEWINETFLMTEAQKALAEGLADSNKQIVEYNKQIEELGRQISLLGKTASEQAEIKLRFTIEDQDTALARMRDMQNEIHGLRDGLITLPEALAVVRNAWKEFHKDATEEDVKKAVPESLGFDKLITKLSEFQQLYKSKSDLFARQRELDENQLGLELTADQTQNDAARLNAHVAANAARLERDHEMRRLFLIETQASNADILIEDFRFSQQKNQQAENALKEQLAILQRDPTKNAAKITEINGQITALEEQHQAELTKLLADGIEKRRALYLKVVTDFQQQTILNVGKQFEEAQKSALMLAQSLEKVHEAEQRLQDVKIGAEVSANVQRVQQLAEAQVISEGQANEQLKAIYQQEEAARLEHWNKMEADQQARVADLQKQVAQAKDNPYFTDEQLAQLQKNLNEAEIALMQTDSRIIEIQSSTQLKLGSLQDALLKHAGQSWNSYFRLLLSGSLKAGAALKKFGELFSEAMGQAVSAAVSGSQTMGEAMKSMLKSILAALAGEATVRAVRQIAYAFEDLATPGMEGHAATHFISAAKWGALAAAAAVAGAAIPSGGGAESSPSAPGNLPPTPATTPTQNPTQGVNATHLAAGGLITHPTLAIVGDSLNASRDSAREAVLPLTDSRAMDAIGTAISERLRSDISLPNAPTLQDALQRAFGGTPINNFFTNNNFKGDLVDHSNLMRVQSRMVRKGRARLLGSEALRVTRRA